MCGRKERVAVLKVLPQRIQRRLSYKCSNFDVQDRETKDENSLNIDFMSPVLILLLLLVLCMIILFVYFILRITLNLLVSSSRL